MDTTLTVQAPVTPHQAAPKVRSCVFMLAGEPFAVALDATREIVTIDECTKVPLAPPMVLGVMNLRGTLVPLVDVRTVLGLPAGANRPRLALLLVAEGLQFAMAIDRVVGLAALNELPGLRDTARRRFGECGIGVAEMGDLLPTLLDARSIARSLMAPARSSTHAPAERE